MKLRFAEEALAEYIAAGQYYNGQVPSLGDAFLNEVEVGVGKILAAPSTWRVIEDDVRRFLVSQFPYGIYCTIEADIVVTGR